MCRVPRDLLGRPPAVVRLRTSIRGWNDIVHQLVAGHRTRVVAIEPEDSGIGVRTATGVYVSLHPSEIEIVSFEKDDHLE